MSPHSETWDLIPWLINGRAQGEERQRAQEHLRSCAACREELEWQRHVQAQMAENASLAQLPNASLQKLLTMIDSEERSAAVPARPAMSARSPLVRWLVAAVVVESIGFLLLGMAFWHRDNTQAIQASYRTVTTPAPQPANAAIRAVFSPQLQLRELQPLLAASHVQIVSGPTESGVYALALTRPGNSQAVAAALTALRTHPDVRFAEPIAELTP